MIERPAKEQLSPSDRAKDRLNAYRDMQRDIDNQIERLARISAKIDSPGSAIPNDMPKTPGYSGDRLADQVIRKMELEKDIQLAIDDERSEYKAIKLITTRMRKADERAIIQLRYLDGAKWSEINEVIHGSREDFAERAEDYQRQTYRKHGTALLSFTAAWDKLEAKSAAVKKRAKEGR